MGLDVLACNRIHWLDAWYDEENGTAVLRDTGKVLNWDQFFVANINPDFPGRADEIEHGALYGFDKEIRFRAGAYSTYNRWREKLARFAGYTSQEDCWSGTEGPFWELINFSDCEGDLGTATCRKLLADFRSFHSMDEDYLAWMSLFEHAADNGVVRFL